MNFRNSRKPRIKPAKIKCEVLDKKTGKIMVRNKQEIDHIKYVNPTDIVENSVKITLILNPEGIWAIFHENAKYKPFEIKDGDLIKE